MHKWLIVLCVPILLFSQQVEQTITNSIGLELVLIPAGEFQMGSDWDEAWRQEDEKPHVVNLTNDFYMSRTEITQVQWESVMDYNRSSRKGDTLPAEKMSWREAVAFCEKLSEMEGKTYRLPTEAEWEYACRAGSGEPFYGKLNDVAWYAMNSNSQTHPVAEKEPNAWGLYDMHGNVSEWCLDYYEPSYPDSAQNPTGPQEGTIKVIRGGSFATFPAGLRAAARQNGPPAYKYIETGFRIVCEID